MPSHSYVDIDFEHYIGPNRRSTGVFVKSGNSEPITGELGKDWWPDGSARQLYFEAQIRRIVNATQCRCIPVHIEWRSGELNQLDKGCIGHSFAGENSFIEGVSRNNLGEVTHVIVRGCFAELQGQC